MEKGFYVEKRELKTPSIIRTETRTVFDDDIDD